MTTSTQVTVPTGMTLPAHLQTPEIAAQIAAANAAAAGGVKIGSAFPRISIENNQFSIIDGDETTLLRNPPAQPGQPALPMMCLEIVIVAANPAVSKTYYPGKWVRGGEAIAPSCKSSNGVVPDVGVDDPQSTACAVCPQNQWGSKVSELSGKDIKACDDSKQLAVLPANDLQFKALGFSIKKGSLKNWGLYIKDLTGRGYPVSGLVTNVTFDADTTGVLNFSVNRWLTAEEYAHVQQRATGSDVQNIVDSGMPSVPQLPAPAKVIQLAPPVQAALAAASPPVTNSPALAPTPDPVPPKRTRRTREQIAADEAAKVSKAAPVPTVDPFAGQAAHVKPAVEAAGGLGTPGGDAVFKALTNNAVYAPNLLAPSHTAATPVVGQPTATPAVVAAGASLKEKLMAKLNANRPAA